ncbi:alpha-amylase family glycosyl hydrolase [Trichlorobacter ammonificans]|uniref:Alpha amylase catalytic region n=1 Tax=Trichlorobacter ammonificans TaxID=2916410 RepID=A0ABM9DAN9_9BACT|nr:alpha-amylase family glycosyl hydrolase [Trichlorobacter ammonificans]CAH2032233.1 Alpha amylase catalytic region [Trichlorobacter ammonificans]
MTIPSAMTSYFPLSFPLSAAARHILNLAPFLDDFGRHTYPQIIACRRIAAALSAGSANGERPVSAATLLLYGTLLDIWRYLIDEIVAGEQREPLLTALKQCGLPPDDGAVQVTCRTFLHLFPPRPELVASPRQHLLLRELLLLHISADNRAVDPFRLLQDDRELAATSPYRQVAGHLEQSLATGPLLPGFGMTLPEVLRAPLRAAPDSLAAQLGFVRDHWGELLPPELLEELLVSFDILEEERRSRSAGGPGPSPVLSFGKAGSDGAAGGGLAPEHLAGYDQPEYEAFSRDADWMSNVVMMAKMTHVWLDQLSRSHSYPITRLDQVPDAELDRLASWGFSGLWLIGLWERSPASRRIKELCGNPDAHASAYSLFDYTIAADLGGESAFLNLKERAWQRGIRLASDMVPNHTGIYSRWVLEHPHWFIQSDHCPFPTYQFTGEDLSHEPSVTLQIEDGYWTRRDAAVVFRMIDRRDGRTRYIYHGNDGTSIPWNDTAQLNYLLAEVREAVIRTILHVARLTPIIRFDAAMTLAKKHYQRLWFPQRGLGGGIPSRAEHAMGRDEFDAVFPVEFWREVVDRMAVEAPDTLLLAEAFWMMEGYFVRTLGMHRVYNSAFMNMLKQEENHKYRQTIRNVLEFNPEILKRFVNFMNNPDEKTAVEQFGSQGKYFGVCVLLATMPGLPMFGHGQIEGFKEKYGMEYRRAYWQEAVDDGLLRGHELWIFPLLKRRWLFSGSEHFIFYDFVTHDGGVDDNVFAYSNRAGNDRVLVLYHNRFDRTAGWLRDSVPFSTDTGTGGRELRSTTLAAALGVEQQHDGYLLFRDLARDLEFIRPVAEVREKGLFADLGDYEFHVFLDFRHRIEEEDGYWGKLCAHLGGRGVASLDEERIQLEYATLITAFEGLLHLLPSATGTPLPADELSVALGRYQDELLSVADQAETDAIITTLRDACRPALCRKAVRLLRNQGVTRTQLVLSPRERRLALATSLLRKLFTPPSSDLLHHHGLDRPLAAFITDDPLAERAWGRWNAALCSATATACSAWSASSLPTTGGRCSAVLATEEVRSFLLVHEDNGILWFNKERFEELFCRLTLHTAFDAARKLPVPVVPAAKLLDLAAAAGYRLRSLLHLLAGGAAE